MNSPFSMLQAWRLEHCMAEAGLEKLGLETPSPRCAQGSLLPVTQGKLPGFEISASQLSRSSEKATLPIDRKLCSSIRTSFVHLRLRYLGNTFIEDNKPDHTEAHSSRTAFLSFGRVRLTNSFQLTSAAVPTCTIMWSVQR